MKAANACYPCLANLVRQAAGLATENPELKARAIEEGLKLLDREFSREKVSIAVATPLHRVVKRVTGNHDPYRRMKEAEVEMSRSLRRDWKNNPAATLRDHMVLAVLGNNIDFFKELKQIKKDISIPVKFAVDQIKKCETRLKKARRILYLADNAGEVFFDIPLVRKLEEYARVTYVVKESPVQNDITLADLKEFGMEKEVPEVITTGTDTPGVDMAMASDEFKLAFSTADLVLAKGMGYWETLSELRPEGKVFYLLKAKCKPVADSLGVGLNSYVALLR